MSARYAKGATLASEIQARLAALARAHDLTRPSLPGVESKQTPTTIRALIEAILAPYLDNRHERLSVTGPDAEIQEQSVTSLALVLYELATNAVKCGAFSVPTGSVHIDLSVASGKFELQWKERGGPEVPKTPDHRGFGTNLIRRIVSDQFAGEVFFDWNPEGLVFRLTSPSDRVISVTTAHLNVASTANANGPVSAGPHPTLVNCGDAVEKFNGPSAAFASAASEGGTWMPALLKAMSSRPYSVTERRYPSNRPSLKTPHAL